MTDLEKIELSIRRCAEKAAGSPLSFWLEKLAEQIAADERDRQPPREPDTAERLLGLTIRRLETEVERLRKALVEEQERCAIIALEQRREWGTPWDLACTTIAAAIRASRSREG